MNPIEQVYYSSVKLPSSYFEKYKKVPPFPGQKESGPWNKYDGWKGHDFPRVWCILDFIEWTKDLPSSETIGATCQDDPELEFIENKFKHRRLFEYPPYDLHQMPPIDEPAKLDFFLFSQTLEHLYSPALAMQNIRAMMKMGGLVFTSVPTINIPHMTPTHFGGFTPMGLAMLFLTSRFEVLKIGQWGNYDYIKSLFKTHRWPDFYDLANDDGEVTNEEQNCCQCWILARAI